MQLLALEMGRPDALEKKENRIVLLRTFHISNGAAIANVSAA
jgi:hypothetical protein